MHDIEVDTNVLVAALRSRRGASFQVIRRIDGDDFRVNISVALALEYEEILKRADLVSGFSEAEVDTFLNYMFKASNLVPSVAPLRPNLPDPDDELVLDLAVQRHAIILTYNKKDFDAAKKLGVRVMSPLEFLGVLRQEI